MFTILRNRLVGVIRKVSSDLGLFENHDGEDMIALRDEEVEDQEERRNII